MSNKLIYGLLTGVFLFSFLLINNSDFLLSNGEVVAGAIGEDGSDDGGDDMIGEDGCTPGFWKNHTGNKGNKGNQWPEGISTGDSYEITFGVILDQDVTLLQALKAKGGGINAFLRHSTAAYLNASSPDVFYPSTTNEVISLVQMTIPNGDIEGNKDLFDKFNNGNCPGPFETVIMDG